jgi:hypothetical protein
MKHGGTNSICGKKRLGPLFAWSCASVCNGLATAVLELPQGQLSLFPEDVAEDWSSLDGQQQLDTILKTRLKGLKDERKEVELLLSAARRCEASGPDP